MEMCHTCPPEKIEFFAHSGECRYCRTQGAPGIVKMWYDDNTLRPRFDRCSCLYCGQHYYVEFNGTVEEWEQQQWEQKAATGE
jgi:hypothetical protein